MNFYASIIVQPEGTPEFPPTGHVAFLFLTNVPVAGTDSINLKIASDSVCTSSISGKDTLLSLLQPWNKLLNS